jgi:hypothetical protein
MPRILELKEVNSEVWARLDLKNVSSPVTLYTNEELHAIKEELKRDIIHAIIHLDDIIWPCEIEKDD